VLTFHINQAWIVAKKISLQPFNALEHLAAFIPEGNFHHDKGRQIFQRNFFSTSGGQYRDLANCPLVSQLFGAMFHLCKSTFQNFGGSLFNVSCVTEIKV